MCLAIPGSVTSVKGDDLTRRGVVDFGGVTREVSLAYIEDAAVGDWVLVHAGFAISKIDSEEAADVQSLLDEMISADELTERRS